MLGEAVAFAGLCTSGVLWVMETCSPAGWSGEAGAQAKELLSPWQEDS